MPKRFRPSNMKLKRADAHIEEAEKAIKVFVGSNPFAMKRELVAVRGVEQLVFRQIRHIPCELELIAADAIHNLRTALDLLMCDLWRINGATDLAEAKFPFTRKVEDFRSRLIQMTRPLPERDRELISRFHPYRGGNDFLWSLHEMDISDKHREIVAFGRAVPGVDGWFEVRTPSGRGFELARDLPMALEEGEPWLTVEAGSVVRFDLTVTCDLKFRFHEMRAHSVSAALREFKQIVAKIISDFDQAYSSS